ncbi:hypothetical protein C8K63_101442 [Pseudomonas sp. GV085]|nr:hypothetical protein C8K63_101442 [Pseudomonas sp. GV085]
MMFKPLDYPAALFFRCDCGYEITSPTYLSATDTPPP